MAVGVVASSIGLLQSYGPSTQDSARLKLELTALAGHLLQQAVATKNYKPCPEKLQLAPLKNLLEAICKMEDLSRSDLKCCKRALRVISVTNLVLNLIGSSEVSAWLCQLEETIFSPRFIHASQSDPERRKILQATKCLIPHLRALAPDSNRSKILFLTTLAELVSVRESLLQNPAYHGPAALFLCYDLYPHYFQSKEILLENIDAFFEEYISRLCLLPDQFIILPGLGLNVTAMRVVNLPDSLHFDDNLWVLGKTREPSLSRLLATCFPSYRASLPTYTFDKKQLDFHPLSHLCESHNSALTDALNQCPVTSQYSLQSYEANLHTRFHYIGWILPIPREGINYFVLHMAKPYLNVLIRLPSGEIKSEMCAYDAETGLYQWQMQEQPTPGRSVYELVAGLYPHEKIASIDSPNREKLARFHQHRAASFAPVIHEGKHALGDEYYCILEESSRELSPDYDRVNGAVKTLLGTLFSQASFIRARSSPLHRERMHSTGPLAHALRELVSRNSMPLDHIPIYNLLHDLCIAALLPTDVCINIGSYYHGPAFLFQVSERCPQFFSLDLAKRHKAFEEYATGPYITRDGYFVLPNFGSPDSMGATIFTCHKSKRLMHDVNYNGNWVFDTDTKRARPFRDFRALLCSLDLSLNPASPTYSVKIPLPEDAMPSQRGFHDIFVSDLQYFAETSLPPSTEGIVYCLIRAHSQLCYYLLCRDANEVRSFLLRYNLETHSYTQVSKSGKREGSLEEILQQLFPDRMHLPYPPLNRNQATVKEDEDSHL